MTTDLDDLLALLPDNDTGQISANDLRTIVTSLWAHTWVGEQYPYLFSTSATPPKGAVNTPVWTTAITTLNVSDQATDNTNLGYGRLDVPGTLIRVHSTATQVLIAEIVAPATINSGWRTLHVRGASAIGAAPADKSQVTITVLGEYTR